MVPIAVTSCVPVNRCAITEESVHWSTVYHLVSANMALAEVPANVVCRASPGPTVKGKIL